MSRNRDLTVARLRLIALRWAGGPTSTADADRWQGHEPEAGPDAGSGAPGPGYDAATGPAQAVVVEEWAADDPRMGADSDERTPRTTWGWLIAVLAIVAIGAGAVALMFSWPRVVDSGEPTTAPSSSHQASSMGPDPSSGATSSPALVAAGEAFPPTAPVIPVGSVAPPDGSLPQPDGSVVHPEGEVVVHVVGAVRRPGIVTLAAGSRVADAVAAAGGLLRNRSVGGTNLARTVIDGERIDVGAKDDAGPVTGGTGQGAAGAPDVPAGPVNLNTATAAQLDALPGVGPAIAAKILAWRAANTRFATVDQLSEVPGIGPRRLEELRPLVRV